MSEPNSNPENQSPDISVVITTRDRIDDLRNALDSCRQQQGNFEVIVIDDASSDETCEVVERDFPEVKLVRNEVRTGLIVARNRGAKAARGKFIVSIDDDAAFSSPQILQQVLALFDDPVIGALAIPFVNHRGDQQQRWFPLPPDREQCWIVSHYVGTAHAINRELFNKLNGYEESLFHWSEERDFCQRLYDAGYVVRTGWCDDINHYLQQAGRHTIARNLYIFRNTILLAFYRAPLSKLPWELIKAFGFSAKAIVTKGNMAALVGMFRGISGIIGNWNRRKPLSRSGMTAWQNLKAKEPVLLGDFKKTSSEH